MSRKRSGKSAMQKQKSRIQRSQRKYSMEFLVEDNFGNKFKMPPWYNKLDKLPKGEFENSDKDDWEVAKEFFQDGKASIIPFNDPFYTSDIEFFPKGQGNNIISNKEENKKHPLLYFYRDPLNPLWDLTRLCVDEKPLKDEPDSHSNINNLLSQVSERNLGGNDEEDDNEEESMDYDDYLKSQRNFSIHRMESEKKSEPKIIKTESQKFDCHNNYGFLYQWHFEKPRRINEILRNEPGLQKIIEGKGVRFSTMRNNFSSLETNQECNEDTICMHLVQTKHFDNDGYRKNATELVSEFSIPINLVFKLIEKKILICAKVFGVDVTKLLLNAGTNANEWNPINGSNIKTGKTKKSALINPAILHKLKKRKVI